MVPTIPTRFCLGSTGQRLGYGQAMAGPDEEIEDRDRREEIKAREDLDPEQIAEDAAELFGAEDRSRPAGDADAPPPG